MTAYTLKKSPDDVRKLLTCQVDELKELINLIVTPGDQNPGVPLYERHHKWKKYTETVFAGSFEEQWSAISEVFSYKMMPEERRRYCSKEEIEQDSEMYLRTTLLNLESLLERLHLMPTTTPELSRAPGSTAVATNSSHIKIFISHSAKDAAAARAIVELLEGSLHVGDKAIRCTSVEGYKLKPGDNSADILRAEIQSCEVLIALLTSDSLASNFVLLELGAAWVLNKRVCLVLAPSVEWSNLPGPFASIHGVKADDRNGLLSVLEVVEDATGFKPKPRLKGDACLTNTLATLKKLFP